MEQPMEQPVERLADLGEWELLRRLARYAPPGQFDDDAALIPDGQDPAQAGEAGRRQADLVVNTDVLVEGIHFSDATMGPADLGWRASAANLSDLAAMGCRQVVGLTVGLVAPAQTPWPWVAGVYDGLHQSLEHYGGTLLGGDCSGGSQRLLAVTALGRLGRGPIRRRDGRAGDWLVSTGPHGLSRLGLALLLGELDPATAGLDGVLCQQAITAHRRPRPRFDAVASLEACQPASSPWRVGGTDSSDGLAAAVVAIARASGCRARLERQSLPLTPALAALASGEAWCLGGGEDFELVLAIAPDWAEALLAALPGAGRIGELAAEPAAPGEPWLTWSDSDAPLPEGVAGFSHFRP
ncbi:thiamine-phosphate kinase [Vulcanococcus limneticus]|uniref:thiamine-phosphate kinase n=1 Tax=Vulcanococcus limneticus TaxID=2170428 RepID=UPI00398BD8EF